MPAISFNVTRVGDLTKTGAINWALEGDVPDGDLAANQAKSGTLNWAANEAAAKTVVINTLGNTRDDPNRTCRIRLSAPVNGVLGADNATTTINDDDATPTNQLPAGYPAIPDFTGASTASVNTQTELQNAIDSTPTNGSRVITCAASVNYNDIGCNRGAARIKVICNSPRFSSLITERSQLDGINLNITSHTDADFISNTIPGGLKAHSATARINIPNLRKCGTFWIEGFDFFGNTDRLLVNRTSSRTDGVDKMWIRKCAFMENDTNNTGFGGTSGRGCDEIVFWENLFQADGSRSDPEQAEGGIWTDYGIQTYNCGNVYVYKAIFLGGWNHCISSKLATDDIRVDDSVFANWHPIADSWKNFELGQEGSPTGNDRTCGMTRVNGCTFTNAVGTTAFRIAMLKDCQGIKFDGCLFYDSQGNLLDILPAPNTGGVDRNGPNDQGRLAGTGGVEFTNCRFGRATLVVPRPVNLNSMYTGTGGGYEFRASNNQASGNRTVNTQSSKVTTKYGANPRFSGT